MSSNDSEGTVTEPTGNHRSRTIVTWLVMSIITTILALSTTVILGIVVLRQLWTEGRSDNLAAAAPPTGPVASAADPSTTAPDSDSPTASSETAPVRTTEDGGAGTARPTTASGEDEWTLGVPDPEAVFVPVYENEALTLNPVEDGDCRSFDLDIPSVLPDEFDESRDGKACWGRGALGGGSELGFSDTRFALPTDATPTPQNCVERMSRAPSDPTVTPSQDLVLCATSNGAGAPGEPVRTKIVVVRVLGVSDSGVVNLSASAWEVPR